MSSLCQLLEQHHLEEPEKPRSGGMMMRNATLPAVLQALNLGPSSQALVTDEGGDFFDGPMARELPAQNTLWSGQDYAVHRASAEPYVLRDARFSIDLMLQPKAARKFLKERGEEALGNGFMARCLFAYPISWRGFRVQTEPSAEVQAALENFHNRVLELLKEAEARQGQPRKILELSLGAKQAWRDFSAWAEAAQRPGAAWAMLPSFASKAAEQAARIAGIFHAITKAEGPISEVTMRMAIEVAHWHVFEAVRILCNQEITAPMKDLQDVYNWAWDRCSRTQQVEYALSDLLRFVPHKLRKKALLIPILNNIVAQGLGMWTTQNPKRPAFTFRMMQTPLHYQVDSNVLA